MTLADQIKALPEWPKPMRGMPLESAADQLDAALARLALAREWIETAHGNDCRGYEKCTCGRDALLKALEAPK